MVEARGEAALIELTAERMALMAECAGVCDAEELAVRALGAVLERGAWV